MHTFTSKLTHTWHHLNARSMYTHQNMKNCVHVQISIYTNVCIHKNENMFTYIYIHPDSHTHGITSTRVPASRWGVGNVRCLQRMNTTPPCCELHGTAQYDAHVRVFSNVNIYI